MAQTKKDKELIQKERAKEYDIKVAGEAKEENLESKIDELKKLEQAEKKRVQDLLEKEKLAESKLLATKQTGQKDLESALQNAKTQK